MHDSLSSKPKFIIEADETGGALGAMFLSVPGDVDGDGVADAYASDFANSAKGTVHGAHRGPLRKRRASSSDAHGRNGWRRVRTSRRWPATSMVMVTRI